MLAPHFILWWASLACRLYVYFRMSGGRGDMDRMIKNRTRTAGCRALIFFFNRTPDGRGLIIVWVTPMRDDR